MPKEWYGSIEDVLASGEYDQGDRVLIEYDELYDLAEQARLLTRAGLPAATKEVIERTSNRPLHPVLGGKSPYSEFLPIGQPG